MGMPFRIVLYAPNPAAAQAAAKAAFNRIAALNALLSDYEDDSELSKLSRTAGTGRFVPLSQDLWRVLTRAQAIARRSDGAFDVTVGPCVQLWRRARRQRALPEPTRLADARKAVGYKHLTLDPRTRSARLHAPGMRLDLGGIAKGYALDEALAVLRTRGLSSALVAAGGDLVVGNPPPGKKGWRIEVAPLDAPGAPPARHVLLRNQALATSGDLYQRVEIDGRRYSHIVDPHTGIGLTDHALVTVIADDGMTADALATAVSVLGPASGFRLVDKERHAAALMARQPENAIELSETRAFRRFLEAGPRATSQ